MATITNKYIFSGHESFPYKTLRLKKGYDFVVQGNKFSDPDAVIKLGVGKNILASAQLQESQKIKSGKNVVPLFELAHETHYVSEDFPLATAQQLYPLDLFSAYTITTAIRRYGQNERSLLLKC